ncbi:PREDICTED: PTI1-like tyrosine-protein kinase At3g15890 [Erythranthe guttata]|uniref:PTI1-like tyrosine-protein kinase At3g15890 n=1 Tax=Erythranthe guttata TaxID=4155 RepID=UPI00064DCD29|nr:PREDICTED: PTI1-like tyrosine-protein kinase At3g15890 [Erythranthe guttata]|eukprot:XP_012852624.1 PREDICTED: PTI1-like tyrosine-protein kinase At3g15890 [Erythranthe guttata]
MGFFSMICCVKDLERKKQGEHNSKVRIFTLKELELATNNFNNGNKLGGGEFSSVYWGQLSNGSQIAVRRWEAGRNRSNTTDREFALEIEIMARAHHENLLSLRGFCAQGQERLIVYDYMINHSLESHLFPGRQQQSATCHLDWTRRMSIAIGAAEAIALFYSISYLHNHATAHIIHRDIKANNVLLDVNFKARVADFRSAKFLPDGATHVVTGLKGSVGYVAPEYAMQGKASKCCDVYSFGILLLELVSGKRTADCMIEIWAVRLACERKFDEIADRGLNGNYVEEEMKRVVLVGVACASIEPEKRPTMIEVVEMLKGDKAKLLVLENLICSLWFQNRFDFEKQSFDSS